MSTPSKADRRAARTAPKVDTFAGMTARMLQADDDVRQGLTYVWPDARFANDFDGFCRTILGIETWDLQAEIGDAVSTCERVAVRSGRKCGKTTIAACLALWYWATRPDAQVLVTATTAAQINAVFWRELSIRYHKALHPLGGQLNLMAANGLKDGFRTIVGFSPRDREAAAGISGTNILYLVDEASGVEDDVFYTIDGNLAGGGDCKLLLISNPTRNEGYFHDVFAQKKVAQQWKTFTLSSEQTPNAVSGQTLVPGLASASWVKYMANRYGVDSPEYIVHVKGEHALGEDGKAIPLSMVIKAIDAHDSDAVPAAPLYIGLDPAGDTLKGDETALTARRGLAMLGQVTKRGLTVDGVISTLAEFIAQYRADASELATVVVDEGGEIGVNVVRALRERERDLNIKIVRVRSSDKAVRYFHNVERRSAELVWNLREWLRNGGTILDIENLSQEIRAWEFIRVKHDSEKVKVDKNAVRKALGRSPDRFDSLALACWEDTTADRPTDDAVREVAKMRALPANGRGGKLDPFRGRGRGIDPWRR